MSATQDIVSQPRPRQFISVGSKLAVATFMVMALVTAGVYVGLSRFEREKMIAAKEQGARMAGELFLRQASTPVVFDDATGIKDTVSLLTKDPEVLGVELWRAPAANQVGERIAAQFKSADERGVAARWVDGNTIDRMPDRIVFRDAVRDQDNKVIAAAAIQYSLANENQAFSQLRQRIILVAGGTAAFLTLLLLAVSRRWIVGPLGRLLGAVKQVEDGKRVDLGSASAHDEVGRLAEAFGRMADAVERRERDIARRNEDMKLVLDNVGQGFLVLDVEGRIAAERSAIVDRWFGVPTPGQTIDAYLAAIDPRVAAGMELGLAAIRDDFMPLELNIEQLPRRLRHGNRYYHCEFHPIMVGETLRQLVLVISDVTPAVERDRAEAAQRDLMAAISRMLADKPAFLGFLNDASGLVAKIAAASPTTNSVADCMREIHTLKGNCGIFGLSGLAAFCHELEDQASEASALPPAEERAILEQRWATLNLQLRMFVTTDRQSVELSQAEYDAFSAAIQANAPRAQLLAQMELWTHEPVSPRLERLAEYAKALAERLEKCPVEVEVATNDLRLPHEPWSRLWPSLVHVVRNAVDHGLENNVERDASGKSTVAHLTLSVTASPNDIAITIADDGRGIDWESVARKATALGLPSRTREEQIAAMFADGLSTRDSATDTSGRGVGLAALQRDVTALGGTIGIESQPALGTRFILRFPSANPMNGPRGAQRAVQPIRAELEAHR